MVDQEMVERKIRLIHDDLTKLGEFRDASFDDIAKDYWKHKAVERVIEVIVGEAIDINQHLIVKSGKGELPFDFKESFLLLADLGVYPKDFAEAIAKSVGLRNILVHQYRKLDEQMFYASIRDCLVQYTGYCRFIADYLKHADETTAS